MASSRGQMPGNRELLDSFPIPRKMFHLETGYKIGNSAFQVAVASVLRTLPAGTPLTSRHNVIRNTTNPLPTLHTELRFRFGNSSVRSAVHAQRAGNRLR